MNDLIAALAAEDPARTATPSAAEATRMDDALRVLLADDPPAAADDARVGPAGVPRAWAADDARLGAAGAPRVGAADDARLGAAGVPRVGSADDARLGAAGVPRVGSADDARLGAAGVPAADAPGLGAAGVPRASAADERSRRRDRRAAAPRRRAWALVPVALGTAALSLGVAVPGGKTPAVIAPPPASAATVLTELRGKAATTTVPNGRYAYQKQLAYVSHMRGSTGTGGRFVVVLPHELEQWVDADGNAVGKEVIHQNQATFPTPEDKAAYERIGEGPPPYQSEPYRIREFKVAGLTVPEVAQLPTEPTALRSALERGELALLPATAQLLASPIASARLKAALLSVLKALPGARLVPSAQDPQGRTGVGVEFEDDAWRTLFLFDPDTGALLGTRSIGKQEVPGRTISDWWLVVDATRTDTAPKTAR